MQFKRHPSICKKQCTMNQNNIPQDPFILLSYINMKLRNEYTSLNELCESMDVSRKSLEVKLASIGYRYDENLNKFV